MSEQPIGRPVRPRVDQSAADTETLVELGLVEEPPDPAPPVDPEAPPVEEPEPPIEEPPADETDPPVEEIPETP